MDSDSMINEFVRRTGSSIQIAEQLLREHDWSVERAINSFRTVSDTTMLPPTSTQRSLDSKPFSSSGGLQLLSNNNSETDVVDCRRLDSSNGQNNSSPFSTLNRRLKRGMSQIAESVQILNISRDVVVHAEGNSDGCRCFVDTPEYTFIVPDINQYPKEFRDYVKRDLIETSTLVSLEQAGRLNWWTELGACRRLLPLTTTGDGNCLLHAASLAVWGLHDLLLTLRKALCQTMISSTFRDAFFRRWRWNQTQMNKQSELVYSEQEWIEEWDNLAKLASAQPRIHPSGQNGRNSPAGSCGRCSNDDKESDEDTEVLYESLEELHVFVLAHVFRRPIIIVADTILKNPNGEALAPISFGGIYLPLECDPCDCHRSPLLLTYDAAHFSALVPMEDNSEAIVLADAIPLVDPDFKLLPVHFTYDPGPDFYWSSLRSLDGDSASVSAQETSDADLLDMLQKYLDVEQVSVPFTADDKSETVDVNDASVEVPMEDSIQPNNLPESETVKDVDEIVKVDDPIPEKKNKNKNKLQKFAKRIGRSLRRTLSMGFCASGRHEDSEMFEGQEPGEFRKKSVQPKVAKRTFEIHELKCHDRILCAKLFHRRNGSHEDVMMKYLASALERFNQEKDFARQQSLEQKVDQREFDRVHCINTDCKGLATADMCYLCPECFEKQKQEELSLNKSVSTTSPSNCSGVNKSESEANRQTQYIPPGGIPHTQRHTGYPPLTGYGAVKVTAAIPKKNHVEESLNTSAGNSTLSNVHRKGSEKLSSNHFDGGIQNEPLHSNHITSVTNGISANIGDLHRRDDEADLSNAVYLKNAQNLEGKSVTPKKEMIHNATSVQNGNHYPDWRNSEECLGSGTPRLSDPIVVKSFHDDDRLTPSAETNLWISKSAMSSMAEPQLCKTPGCRFYGVESTDFLCSRCYQQKLVQCSSRGGAQIIATEPVML